ncbi:hypothetical protein EMIHUDRAFT_231420 [Emiliania huxleyi CCMP1516]|uniref:Uncharacterized protein n=2 Tax=Emiliania huxleyi TaxID=2903 RepID=A0A0D3K7Q1_EMIH1|nr:hypothetical protein EMIHUDRAFT_231420 [Emiliania huxleyi CCMP1516]EOD31786.1 hypothetical protein EMIHUDRAFT_231420 [Emiliania huxleyi CCMP1516]|eukprot:XP_005784215.1 hypothetical protein EMIHUDRAFT_231420 [Emiliania huxleyi CCMP1516]
MARSDLSAAPRLVDKATRECGQAGSGESAWVALKDFARCSDAHLLAIAGAVWEHLGAPHSQARWQALELCARLWPRSAAFRHALMRDIPTFVQLVCAIAPAASAGRAAAARGGLPPPEHWAKQLHRRGVELIERWHASHGHLPEYRQLDLARRRVCTSAASASASLDDGPQAQRWAEQWQQLRDGGAEASLAEAAAAVVQLGTCVQIMAPIDLRQPEQRSEEERAALGEALQGACREARLRLLPKLRAHLAALAHAPLDDDLQSHERRVTRGCEPRLAGRVHTRLLRRVTAARSALLELLLPDGATRTQEGEAAQGEGETDSDSDFEDVPLLPAHSLARTAAASDTPAAAAERAVRSPRSAARAAAALMGASAGAAAGANDGTALCGAPRRDGSLCRVAVPPGGVCPFHGERCERDDDGIPLHDEWRQGGERPPEAPAAEGQAAPAPAPARGEVSPPPPRAKRSRPRRSAAARGGLEEVERPRSHPQLHARLARKRPGGAERRAEAARDANAATRARFNNLW